MHSSNVPLFVLTSLLALSGCHRGPEIATGTATGDRVEAAGVNGESYRTLNGRSAITLISRDELEYRLADGTTLLCKYSEQGNALRVIMTALGTQQVLYFRRVPNGLQSNDGDLYLNTLGLAELRRQEEIARRQRIQEQAAAEAAAQREAAERRTAEQRAALKQQRKDQETSRLLIGSWRDENSVCTYSTDGVMVVRADDGTTGKVRWSVSDGYIVGVWFERNGRPVNWTFRNQIIALTSSNMTYRESTGETWHGTRVK